MLNRKRLFIVIGIIDVLVIFLAFSPMFDDGDQASRLIRQKYGEDIFQQTQTMPCATDGVGIKRVPFGRVVQHCDTHWFVAGVGGITFQY